MKLDTRLAPFVLALLAAAGLWLDQQWRSPALRLAVAACGAVAVWLAARALRRGGAPAGRGARRRLGAFAVVVSLVALAGVSTWLAYNRAMSLVHPPHSYPARTPAATGIADYRDVRFLTGDGLTLAGWYAPARNGVVVIYVHGLAGNRGELLDEAGIISARGYGALLVDLRNSGDSQGATTTLGLEEAEDVRAAIAFVRAQPGGADERIVLYGHSMGGAAVLLAAARAPDASVVVAESAYTSLEGNIGHAFTALTLLPAFPFVPLVVSFGEQETGMRIGQVRPIDAVAAISPRPLLIVHGEQDELVPVENARALYAAAREPKELYLLPEAHHDLPSSADPQSYTPRIADFLDRSLLKP
jgi:fermentation-respiration switch protein FrsA (DUF1100 family)